jgi:hypothetical protein
MTKEPITVLKQRWQREAQKHLVGRRIAGVRWMTQDEQEQLGWDNAAVVLELDNGTLVWPSADDEGNGAGALLGFDAAGNDIDLPVIW